MAILGFSLCQLATAVLDEQELLRKQLQQVNDLLNLAPFQPYSSDNKSEFKVNINTKQKLIQILSVLGLTVTGLVISTHAAAEDSQAALAKASLNPVAALISLPMKLDWDTGFGSTDADRSLWVVQPVIPITLNDKWNVISRTVTPVWIDLEPTSVGGNSTSGMGDILQSFFFSPKAPTSNGWIWGVGPAINIPTSSEPGLGTDTWGLGPTFVVLKQSNGWTYGALGNQLWGLSDGDNGEKSSSMFLQPFLSFTTKKFTTIGINTESSYYWNSKEWTIPLNFSVTQMLKLGKQPLTVQLGYRYYLDAPAGGPDWGVRFQVSLLFPK